MKNIFKVTIVAMSFCMISVYAMGQDEATINIVENPMAKSGVMHEETFEHTTVTITKEKGNPAIGFYMIAADFEGNYPVLLHFVLVTSTDDKIFASVPVEGTFKSDAKGSGGKTAFMKFTDMFFEMFGKPFVDVVFER